MGGYPHIVTLEVRIVKARSSMALQTYLMPYYIKVPHTEWKKTKLITWIIRKGAFSILP